MTASSRSVCIINSSGKSGFFPAGTREEERHPFLGMSLKIVGFWITEKCLKVLTHLSFSFQVITALHCLCHHSSFCILSTHKCSEQVGTLSPVSLCPRHSQMLQVHNREKQILSTTRNESHRALAPASEPRHNPSKAERFYTAIVETISQQDFHTPFL